MFLPLILVLNKSISSSILFLPTGWFNGNKTVTTTGGLIYISWQHVSNHIILGRIICVPVAYRILNYVFFFLWLARFAASISLNRIIIVCPNATLLVMLLMPSQSHRGRKKWKSEQNKNEIGITFSSIFHITVRLPLFTMRQSLCHPLDTDKLGEVEAR